MMQTSRDVMTYSNQYLGVGRKKIKSMRSTIQMCWDNNAFRRMNVRRRSKKEAILYYKML